MELKKLELTIITRCNIQYQQAKPYIVIYGSEGSMAFYQTNKYEYENIPGFPVIGINL